MVNGLSQAAIGRALNLSPAAMTKLKYQGMPVDSIEAAQAWREARQNIAARKQLPPAAASLASSPLPAGSQEEDFHQARTRREIADANLAEMREAEGRGDLIRIDAVRSALASVISSTRDALMQLPSRLTPVLTAETDAARVHDLLQTEIHQALARLTAAPQRLDKEGNPP